VVLGSLASLVAGTALGEERVPPPGLYKGDQGLLQLQATPAGGLTFVTGQVLSDFCNQEPGRVGLEGVLQGGQLVGRVLLCVRCARGGVQEDRVVDFLATWLPEAEEIVGFVTLEPSCNTPGSTTPGQPVRVSFRRDLRGDTPMRPFNTAVLERKAAQEFAAASRLNGERMRAALLRAVSFDPSPRNHARLGAALLVAGDLDGAQLALERATALPTAQWEGFLELSRYWVRRRELGRGLKAFQDAVERRMPNAVSTLNEEDFHPLREAPGYFTWVQELQRSERAK
jgi:hypothetical protein